MSGRGFPPVNLDGPWKQNVILFLPATKDFLLSICFQPSQNVRPILSWQSAQKLMSGETGEGPSRATLRLRSSQGNFLVPRLSSALGFSEAFPGAGASAPPSPQ